MNKLSGTLYPFIFSKLIFPSLETRKIKRDRSNPTTRKKRDTRRVYMLYKEKTHDLLRNFTPMPQNITNKNANIDTNIIFIKLLPSYMSNRDAPFDLKMLRATKTTNEIKLTTIITVNSLRTIQSGTQQNRMRRIFIFN